MNKIGNHLIWLHLQITKIVILKFPNWSGVAKVLGGQSDDALFSSSDHIGRPNCVHY